MSVFLYKRSNKIVQRIKLLRSHIAFMQYGSGSERDSSGTTERRNAAKVMERIARRERNKKALQRRAFFM
jgi:hypothetical protein